MIACNLCFGVNCTCGPTVLLKQREIFVNVFFFFFFLTLLKSAVHGEAYARGRTAQK